MKKIPAATEPTQGKHYQVDFRLMRPLDLAGGNVRNDYPGIPELAESFLDNGKVDGVRFTEMFEHIPRNEWWKRTEEIRKKVQGCYLSEAVNTPLRGYSKTDDGQKLYYTLAGHRRTKAAEMLFKEFGLITLMPFVPKDVRSMSEADIILFMLDENENRRGLDIFEQARTAKRLQDLGKSLGDICVAFRRPRDYFFVRNLLRLDAAPDEVRNMIKDNVIAYSNVVTVIEAIKWEPGKPEMDQTLINELKKLIQAAESKAAEKGGPVKVKARDVHKSVGNIKSNIELARFFRKHKTPPTFADPVKEQIYTVLKQLSENQITLTDLEDMYFPAIEG